MEALAGEQTGEAQKKFSNDSRGSEPVQIRRVQFLVSRATHRPGTLVVAEDEEDVGPL